MNNDEHKASLSNLGEKVILKFDRLSQCYNEPNLEFVKKTCGLLLDDHYQKNIPGMKITANARYHVSCQIPVPFSEVKKSVITFEAGPRRPGVSSFRIDFNPALSRDLGGVGVKSGSWASGWWRPRRPMRYGIRPSKIAFSSSR